MAFLTLAWAAACNGDVAQDDDDTTTRTTSTTNAGGVTCSDGLRCNGDEVCYGCSSDDESVSYNTCGAPAVAPVALPLDACHDRVCDTRVEYCRIQQGWECAVPVSATCLPLPGGCDPNALDCACLENDLDIGACDDADGVLRVSFAVEGEG